MNASQLKSVLEDLNRYCGDDWLSSLSGGWDRRDYFHEVISCYHFATAVASGDDQSILQNEHALRAGFWRDNINAVADLLNWDLFKARIRNNKECQKLLYEIQVAAAYRRLGLNVCFGNSQPYGHDLTVKSDAGSVYVECKKKGETEKDRKVAAIWHDLQIALDKLMKRSGRYAYVYLETSRDPQRSDVNTLVQLIDQRLCKGLEGDDVQGPFSVRVEHVRPAGFSERGNSFGITYPSKQPSSGFGPDAVLPESQFAIGPIWPAGGTLCLIGAARNVGQNGMEITDGRAMGFRSLQERDYLTTVVNSLGAVRSRKQLPPSGPGIVYIEISPVSSEVDVGLRLKEVASVVQPRLRGDLNRRISAVVLTYTGKTFVKVVKGQKEVSQPAIMCVRKIVMHDNALTPFPSGFRI